MFTHLHVHTDASILDGLGTVDELVSTAKSSGFKALAMTDHGTLANAISFNNACNEAGIKPILGVEGYLIVDGDVGHITLLADGKRGFNNLVKLNNLGHASKHRRPAFTVDQLLKYSKNLICLTGCVSSPLNNLPKDDALKLGTKLKAAFGSNLFAEVMFVADIDTWTRPMWLADKLDLQTVVTNDVHFPRQEHAIIHPRVVRMRAGFDYNSEHLWLKKARYIGSRAKAAGIKFKDFKQMVANTGVVADKISSVNLSRTASLPHIEDAENKLLQKINDALHFYDLKTQLKYYDRTMHELDIIIGTGFAAYFLILKDIIDYAKKVGTKVGPGRGSGASSLVLYLLGITEIDPLKHDLIFERFLSKDRKEMPDVDVYFDSVHRKKVIEYTAKKWNAIPIATYSRYSHKSLIHDLAKSFRLGRDVGVEIAERGEDSDIFKTTAAENPDFELAYETMLHQVRHKGKHAGGVIITDAVVPIERVGNELAAAWTEGKQNQLTQAGIVKFDLLGLAALSVIGQLENKLKQIAPEPTDGHATFNIFTKGTLAGIFQFSGSPGIRDLTIRVAPSTFKDLIAINGLYRPGALAAGVTDKYHEWKSKPRKVPELIEDILADTYGAIVFQEQVMAIFARVLGITFSEADGIRKIIVKSRPDNPSWVKKFVKLKEDFLRAAGKKLTPKVATNLWNELATHSKYSFNRAHSTAYARIAWDMAWWKANYPTYFYAESLNYDLSNQQALVLEAVSHGIDIVPPDINKSNILHTADNEHVYMPLSSIKFLGAKGAQAIIDERLNGDFVTTDDFMKRVPKSLVRARAREGFWHLGSFDSLGAMEISKEDLQFSKKYKPPRNKHESYLKYLGIIMPTSRMIKEMERLPVGWSMGIVDHIKEKRSRWGLYKVYYLTPSGVCWSRDAHIEENDIIAIKIKKSNGKLLDYENYNHIL